MVFNAASINMCQPIDLEIPFPVNMSDSFAIEYFSFVAQAGTFDNFFICINPKGIPVAILIIFLLNHLS